MLLSQRVDVESGKLEGKKYERAQKSKRERCWNPRDKQLTKRAPSSSRTKKSQSRDYRAFYSLWLQWTLSRTLFVIIDFTNKKLKKMTIVLKVTIMTENLKEVLVLSLK